MVVGCLRRNCPDQYGGFKEGPRGARACSPGAERRRRNEPGSGNQQCFPSPSGATAGLKGKEGCRPGALAPGFYMLRPLWGLHGGFKGCTANLTAMRRVQALHGVFNGYTAGVKADAPVLTITRRF